MKAIETKFNCLGHVVEQPNDMEYQEVSSIFPKIGRLAGSGFSFILISLEKLQAH